MVTEYATIPELMNNLPRLDEEIYLRIKDNISTNGYDLAFPILIWKDHNTIVDGHNRYKACRELGVEPIIVERSFESLDEAMLYALEHQDDRRNETPTQIAINGTKRYRLIETIAANKRRGETQIKEGRLLPSEANVVLREPQSKGAASKKIAEKAGVSQRIVEQVMAVSDKGVPELQTMMVNKELSANAANTFVQEIQIEDQKEIVKGGPKAVKVRVSEINKKFKEKQERAKKKQEFEDYKKSDTFQNSLAINRKIDENVKKAGQREAAYLKEEFGDFDDATSKVCIVVNGKMQEYWCSPCKNGFDTYIGGQKETAFCPYCGQKDIRPRKIDWYPNRPGGDGDSL